MAVVGVAIGLVAGSVIPSAQAFEWRQFITGFDPYKDDETLVLEEETARLGFVQLNSGSTSFNTTLNLTGPILLGLGIATATLFYAYFNAFSGGSSDSGYGYNRMKRSPDQDMVDPLLMLDKMESDLAKAGLVTAPCRQLAVCTAHMATTPTQATPTLRRIIITAMEGLDGVEGVEERLEVMKKAVVVGREGKNCKKVYNKCGMKHLEVSRVLDMV